MRITVISGVMVYHQVIIGYSTILRLMKLAQASSSIEAMG